MAPVNPYLRKPLKKSTNSKPFSSTGAAPKPKPVAAVMHNTAAPKQSHAPKKPPPSSVPVSSKATSAVVPTIASNKQTRPSPPVDTKPRPPAVMAPTPSLQSNLKPTTKPPMVFSSAKKPKSFKSKLKQEIESLKRAKEAERQRKILEKQQKEQQAKEQDARVYRDLERQKQLEQQQKPSHPPLTHGQAPPPMHPYRCATTNGYPVPTFVVPPTNYVTPAKRVAATIQASQQVPPYATPLTGLQVTPASSGVPAVASAVSKQTEAHNKKGTFMSTVDVAPTTNCLPTQSKPSPGSERKHGYSMEVKSKDKKKDIGPIQSMAEDKMPNEAASSTTNVVGNESVSATKSREETEDSAPYKANQNMSNALLPSHNGTSAGVPSSLPPLTAVASMPYNMPYGIPPIYAPMPMIMSGQPLPPCNWNPYSQYPMVPGQPSYQQYPMMGQPWSQHHPPTALPAPIVPRTAQMTPPKPKSCVLHRLPLDPSSPYADTHKLLPEEIVIYKKVGEPFGVSFAYESRSTLVDPDIANRLNGSRMSDRNSQTPATKENSIVKSNEETLKAAGSGDADNIGAVVSATTTQATNSSASDVKQQKATVDNSSHVVDKPIETDKPPAVQQRRPRRRRVFFGVLQVVAAEKQNAQFKTDDPGKQLKPGDIVLKVNNRDLGGLTFQQAVSHFASCTTKAEASESLIRCRLVVARAKSRAAVPSRPIAPTRVPSLAHGTATVPSKVPFVLNTLTDRIVSGDFTAGEVLALAQGCMRCFAIESRALGHDVSADIALALLQGSGLALRDLASIAKKQSHAIRSLEQSMKAAAMSHWANQWKLEQELSGGTDLQIANLSDAERSALRELPRPSKGCRCGSPNHEFVNDVKCILYRNLRSLSQKKAEPEEERKSTKKAKSSDLNAIQTALKDRILKLKDATEHEEEEARFVEEMEKLQVKKLKRAVFAPSALTAMVLSAVAELAADLSTEDATFEDVIKVKASGTSDSKQTAANAASMVSTTNGTQETEAPSSLKEKPGAQDILDDDEDDDIPLMDLCKRSHSSSFEPEPKRLKVEGTEDMTESKKDVKERLSLNLWFMAKVLHHISHTWGHLYAEPSNSEYSWRWEVYHGQTSTGEAYRDSKLRNPRPPESLSFEHIRFALTKDVMSRLSAAEKQNITSESSGSLSLEASNDILLMSHLLSPKRTGVYDEVMALVKMGVLRRTRTGCLLLAKDWYIHVDPLLLDDMEQHWSKRMDPANKHCINKIIRAKLERSWMRAEEGWSMSDEPNDVIYRDDEWEEWRTHFRDRFDSQIDEADGIEKFGI